MEFIKNFIKSYKTETNKYVQICEMYCSIIIKNDSDYIFLKINNKLAIPEYNIDKNNDFRYYIIEKIKNDFNIDIKLNGIMKIQYITTQKGYSKMKVLFEGRLIKGFNDKFKQYSLKDITHMNNTDFSKRYIKDFVIEFSDKKPYPINMISCNLKPISYENKIKKKLYNSISLYKKGELKLTKSQYTKITNEFNKL